MSFRVSVIIPTYNRWPMVRDGVESVLGQSYQAFELIVVDDGSEDETADRLFGYDPRLRVVRQPRCGVAAARNIGVKTSSGEYLAFLDSDDLWERRKLETQVAFMESRPEVQICQTEEIWIRRGRRVNPKKHHRKPSGDIFRASLELCLVSPSAVMMTRKLYDRAGGFDEALSVCEDYDLWLRIAVDTPILLIPQPLVVKRGGHADQLSRSIWGLDRFRLRALLKLLKSGIGGDKRIWAKETLRRKAMILAKGARKRGKDSEARLYEQLLAEFSGDANYDQREDTRVREGERISLPDSGALA